MKDHFGNELGKGDLVIVPFTPIYKPKSYTVLKLGTIKSVSKGGNFVVVSFNDDSINRTKSIGDSQAIHLFRKVLGPIESDLSGGV